MTAIRAHRLTAGAASTDTYDRHTAEAVYTFLALILPGPRFRDAACRGAHARLWDDALDKPGGEQPDERAARIAKAKTICRGCPEQVACRQARINNPALGWGVFGGQLFTRTEPKPRVPLPIERLPALTHCQRCRRPLPAEKQKWGARNCSTTCRKKASATRPQGTRPPAQPVRTTCQACGGGISAQRQARGANSCSAECKRAAEAERARQRRDATLERPAPVVQAEVPRPQLVAGPTCCANPDCGRPLTGPQRNHGSATCSPGCRASRTTTTGVAA